MAVHSFLVDFTSANRYQPTSEGSPPGRIIEAFPFETCVISQRLSGRRHKAIVCPTGTLSTIGAWRKF
ncbi:MAG: hypothetical protein JOY53_08610 [Acidobacteriaceae bacterium]|nr:hypothetical protein [Acidobacteriaceae bacterium]